MTKAQTAEVRGTNSDEALYSGRIVIPSKVEYDGVTCYVTSIGDYAFKECTNLTSITIPNSVTSIGKWAFAYCKGLTSLVIPNSVKKIDEVAFADCYNITSLTIPNSVTYIGRCAFMNLYRLKSLKIPENLERIYDATFWGCYDLTEVYIPDNIEVVENEAFYGCRSLKTVKIGKNVRGLYYNAFQNCPDLTDVYCYGDEVQGSNKDAFKDSYIEYATLHVPNSLIDEYKKVEPWKNFKNIVAINGEDSGLNDGHVFTVNTKEGVEMTFKIISAKNKTCQLGIGPDNSVTPGALRGVDVSSKGTITIPDYVNYLGIDFEVIGIGDYAFYRCLGVTEVIIPSSVKYIGECAFFWCEDLESVNIPDGVEVIKGYTFYECFSLKEIELPKSIKKIEREAFFNSGLKSIKIPDNVISIEERAFIECDLRSLSIGSGISSIGSGAFGDCEKLQNVYCYAKQVPNAESTVFEDSPIEKATLYVPESAYNSYKTTTPWKDFGTIVTLESNIPETNKCSAPTIGIENGKLIFNSETEGVQYHYEINHSDVKTGEGNNVELTNTYIITVYSYKDGYENSDTVTAEIQVAGGKNGDTNGDGVVNAADIVEIVNMIMSSE